MAALPGPLTDPDTTEGHFQMKFKSMGLHLTLEVMSHRGVGWEGESIQKIAIAIEIQSDFVRVGLGTRVTPGNGVTADTEEKPSLAGVQNIQMAQ